MGKLKFVGYAPLYSVELEFFDVKQGKKRVQRKELSDTESIEPFKNSIQRSEEIGIMKDSGLILTAIRVYKGLEIIFDKYCVSNELSSLNDLF